MITDRLLAASADAATSTVALGPSWLDPQHLIDSFGTYALVGILVIVFVETGLLFPILPGDSLLFTAGAFVASGALHVPLWLLCLLIAVTAFAGDQNAYWIGRRIGPRLFARPDSRLFKKAHLQRTHEFFEKQGGKAVILARFVPFIRTYSAVTAGIGRMDYRTFLVFDAVGAVLWGCGVTLLGYWLGGIGFVRDNIEVLLILVVLVSVVPVAVELLRQRRKARRAAASGPERPVVAPSQTGVPETSARQTASPETDARTPHVASHATPDLRGDRS